MDYRRFRREAEPDKISRCSNCNVELRRSKLVFLLLMVGVIVTCFVEACPYLLFFSPSIVSANKFFFVLFYILWTILVALASVNTINVFGWLFVGWKLASPQQPDPEEK